MLKSKEKIDDACRSVYFNATRTVSVCTGASLMLLSQVAVSQQAKDIMNNMADQGSAAGKLLVIVFGAIGLFLAGFGLFKILKPEPGEGPGAAWKYIIVGTLLFSVTTIVGVTSASLFGSDQSQAIQTEIINF